MQRKGSVSMGIFYDRDDEKPVFVVVELTEELFAECGLHLLAESRWEVSPFDSNYRVRVDPANPALHLPRHATVSHKKHLAAKNMQSSWDEAGHRHDNKTFNASVGGRRVVQDTARRALGLGSDVVLEAATTSEQLLLLLENTVPDLPETASVLRAVKKSS